MTRGIRGSLVLALAVASSASPVGSRADGGGPTAEGSVSWKCPSPGSPPPADRHPELEANALTARKWGVGGIVVLGLIAGVTAVCIGRQVAKTKAKVIETDLEKVKLRESRGDAMSLVRIACRSINVLLEEVSPADRKEVTEQLDWLRERLH